MAINIYEPLNFKTQGIHDLASEPSLIVSNNKITVNTVELKKALTFSGTSLSEVEGLGIKWSDGRRSKSITFNNGRLQTDLSLSLGEEQEIFINENSVLSQTELGKSVTKSYLRSVGVLKTLTVSGSAELGQFTYINSDMNRVGINTDSPAAALGIRDNDVELIVGSSSARTGTVGTITSSQLDIVTDNTPRISISNLGDVTVHGKLYVGEIIANKFGPLVFNNAPNASVYGKGIIWAGLKGPNRQFIYQANPDRIWSSESIDLTEGKSFMIEGTPVLSRTVLGPSVTESNLTKIGILRELQVVGDAAVTRKISTGRLEVGSTILSESNIVYNTRFKVQTKNSVEFDIGSNIVIGSPSNQDRTVVINGKLAVGINNPDSRIGLTVAGPISFNDKRFLTGSSAPTSGQFNKGDIVWNNNPGPTQPVGWICIQDGVPGIWAVFGRIESV